MDDLTRIKGIGTATAKKLAAAGINDFLALALANHTDEPLASIAKSDIEAVGWITAAAALANVPPQGETEPKEKLPGSNQNPEAQLQDGAGLPADSGAGDLQKDLSASAAAAGEGQDPEAGNHPGSGQTEIAQGEAGGDLVADLSAAFPLLAASVNDWKETHGTTSPTALRITARRDGFRRAGIRHTKAAVDHPIEVFTAEQIEALMAEPNLSVELV